MRHNATYSKAKALGPNFPPIAPGLMVTPVSKFNHHGKYHHPGTLHSDRRCRGYHNVPARLRVMAQPSQRSMVCTATHPGLEIVRSPASACADRCRKSCRTCPNGSNLTTPAVLTIHPAYANKATLWEIANYGTLNSPEGNNADRLTQTQLSKYISDN